MLNPTARLALEGSILVADFWDCLRLDPAPVRDLRTRYELEASRHPKLDLVVDLGGVGFAGSAALSGFVTLQNACRKAGGRMIFCNVEPTVLSSFQASRLFALFHFIALREDAIATLGGGGEAAESHPKAAQAPPLPVPPIRTRPQRAKG